MSSGGLAGKDLRPAVALAALLASAALFVGLFRDLGPSASSSAPSGSSSIASSYGKVALGFAPNAGRAGHRVEYSTSTAAGSIALTNNGAVIAPAAKGAEPVRMRLSGAGPVNAVGAQRLPGVVNDFRGANPAEWKTNLPTFARVHYPDVYPGIGLDYYGNDGTLEYDFRVAAGADPSRIAVDFGGAPVRVAGDGDLLIGTGKAAIRQQAPVAYQRGPDGRDSVSSRFDIHHGTVGFSLGSYDHSRPLVIDPLVLSYSTYLGGSDDEELYGLAVDSSGNSYVAGDTASTDFPKQGAYQGTPGSGYDAFVTKLNPTGTALVYSTYLGGNGLDIARDVAVDSSGHAYVTGRTASTDFPVTAGVAQGASGGRGEADVFVTKLNASGSALDYSTYIGGNGEDVGDAIAIGSDGSAYVTGTTHSYTDNTQTPALTPYPTSGAYQASTGNGYGDDAFVTKLTASGTFGYSTYLDDPAVPPTNVSSDGTGIAVDSSGQAYVTGTVTGDAFPTTGSRLEGPTHTQADNRTIDGFLTKFNAAGNSLLYSTYFGGMADDFPTDLAIDSSGRAFIAGSSGSGDSFDLKNQFQGHQGLVYPDAFLTEIDPSQSGASSLVYSTLLDGNQAATASSVAVDSSGDAYVGGSTGSGSSFPKVNPISSTNTGTAFLTKFDTSQSGASSVVYSSTIPTNPSGVGSAGVTALGVLGTDAYVAGSTDSTYYPSTAGAFQTQATSTAAYQKGDGFVSKLTYTSGSDTTPPDTTITSGPADNATISTTTATFGFTSSEPGSTFQCSIDGSAFTSCTSPYTTPALGNTQHTFQVRATDGSNNTDQTPDSRTFTVSTGPPPDTTPPQTTIKDAPPNTIKSSKLPVDVKFTFKSSEPGSTYSCKIDSKAYKPCTSPVKYSLGAGKHTFSVKSTDSSGNQDATAATAKVEVKKKKKHHPHHHHR